MDWREKHEVLRNSSGGYDEVGYNILRKETRYAIGHINHCSCYDTWTYVDGEGEGVPDGLTIEWEGTRRALVRMATKRLDPSMPTRVADPSDYAYTYLEGIYRDVLAADAEGVL